MSYEQDMQRMTNDAMKLTINAVHKPVNPKSHATEKICRKLLEVPRGDNVVESSENQKQNTEDIKQIQKEQVIIKDQLAAVTNALQNFGEQMRGMRTSVENLRYERVDCPCNRTTLLVVLLFDRQEPGTLLAQVSRIDSFRSTAQFTREF